MSFELNPDVLVDGLWPIVSRRVTDRTTAAVELLEDLLRSYGRLHRHEQELRAGTQVLNEDREILPRLARATSLGFSIYLGNRRIASFSALDAGATQQIGGYADATLVDTVLRQRETFRGPIDVAGRPHLVACRPLHTTGASDDYGPLGMVEAYQDITSMRDLFGGALRQAMTVEDEMSDEHRAVGMEEIMHFVDDVARRLQLLALNGNIIAAQAGDHGRAFRVVCRELSSLADQSKDAVGEIRRLMEETNLAYDEANGEAPADDTEEQQTG